MMQKIKLSLLALCSLLVFSAPLAVSGVAYALTDVNNSLCSGANLDLTGNTTNGCDTASTGNSLNTTITTAINVISIIVGAIAVIMIIIGGFRYVTSGGKQESVAGAKTTILYALIGLVIVALAQVVVHFVLAKATNTP